METKSHFKSRVIFIILLCITFFVSCQKENYPMEEITGKWQLVKGRDMTGGVYSVNVENQQIEEYTKDNLRILYDYLENEIARCNFRVTKSVITIYGENIDGTQWDNRYEYWFSNDTLKIRHSGGFEFYDEFFIRIK